MRCRMIITAATMLMAAFLFTVAAPEQSEAEGTDIWFCYNDQVNLSYLYDPEGVDVDWVVDFGDRQQSYSNRDEFVVDATGYDRITVHQTVSDGSVSDSMTIEVVIIPTSEEDPIEIVFMDGGAVYYRDAIEGDRAVRLGESFIRLPQSDPEREGFVFDGWYLDPECTRPLDVKTPIEQSMFVYAGWRTEGGGSSVAVDNHMVVFDTDPGLFCETVGVDAESVTFTVGIIDGFEFEEGSIRVSSSTGTVTRTGDVCHLTGITGDTVVTVTGDRLFSVSYTLDAVTVTAAGYDAPPEKVGAGTLVLNLTPGEGLGLGTVHVYMDGEDVTSQCLDGVTVTIGAVTGDIIIVASAAEGTGGAEDDGREPDGGFPWWVPVLIAVLAAAAVLAYVLHRSRA